MGGRGEGRVEDKKKQKKIKHQQTPYFPTLILFFYHHPQLPQPELIKKTFKLNIFGYQGSLVLATRSKRMQQEREPIKANETKGKKKGGVGREQSVGRNGEAGGCAVGVGSHRRMPAPLRTSVRLPLQATHHDICRELGVFSCY